jgi:hypothetical protein
VRIDMEIISLRCGTNRLCKRFLKRTHSTPASGRDCANRIGLWLQFWIG